MKTVLVFASDCICVDTVNIHTFFLCLSVFGLTCFTHVFAYAIQYNTIQYSLFNEGDVIPQ